MKYLSELMIPFVICFILLYGLFKGINVFDVFLKGAKEGLSITFKILPALIALMTAVGMSIASGAFDIIANALEPITSIFFIPKEVIPLGLLRPVSGSGSLAIYENILSTHGVDSMIGRIASVMQGSTETTFYTIAVYYGSINIIKTRYTLISALTADIVGFIMSSLTVIAFFG